MKGYGVQGDFFINDWLVQPQINTVEKGSRRWHLEPKVMQVLVHLALHPNEVLSKEKIIETIWRDTFVGDDVLIRCISEIRYVFGDDPRSPLIIQTIPKAGYRLIASVNMEVDGASELLITNDRPLKKRNGNHLHRENGLSVPSNGGAAADEDLTALSVPIELPTIKDETTSSEQSAGAIPEETNTTLIQTSSTVEMTPVIPASRRFLWFVMVAVALAAVWGGVSLWRSAHPYPFEVFWAPVLEAREPALFCIADQNQYSFITLRDAAEPSRQIVLKDTLSAVVIDDLDTLVRVAGDLRGHGKEHVIKGAEATTLSDLRNGPSIFVGAFDNAWTLRLIKPLRYHFANDPEMNQFRIVDSNNPSRTDWVIDRTQQMATNNYKDYAIIARFTDINTGKPAVILAGIGRGGTIAAGEFLTDPNDLAQLIRAIDSAGNKKNMEVVLSTQIIDGQPGTPKMEASYFW